MPLPKTKSPECQYCGEYMILRDGKYGKFWSCSEFPKCRGIRKVGEENKVFVHKYKPIVKLPGSEEQEDIWKYMLDAKGHLVVNSGPGTGKTWVGIQGCLRLPKWKSIFFVAFNKHIADEDNDKLKVSKCGNVEAMTFHSLGFKILHGAFEDAVYSDSKMKDILETLCPAPGDNALSGTMLLWRQKINLAKTLCGLVKNHNLDYSAGNFREELTAVADHHGVDLDRAFPTKADLALGERRALSAFELVVPALDACKEQADVCVDFDDMIWLPIVLDLYHKRPCDVMITDESQDLNVVQHELIFRAVKGSGRVFVVGDRRQSIYGFRGAHTQSIDVLKERLGADPRGVQEFPMTITRRCPKLHVQLAQAISPDIRAMDDAPLGEIWNMAISKAVEEMKGGDMVLCRVNKPLIQVAFALIRRNIKPIIKGRDLGAGLAALADRIAKKVARGPCELEDFATELMAHRLKRGAKLMALGDKGEGRLNLLHDQCECLQEFILHSRNLTDMRNRIATIFEQKDDQALSKDGEQSESNNAVVLGTVHRTKGLEAPRVFVLLPNLIPHPMAKKDWEEEQECNIAWVACTRAKYDLSKGEVGVLAFCGETDEDSATPIIYTEGPKKAFAKMKRERKERQERWKEAAEEESYYGRNDE